MAFTDKEMAHIRASAAEWEKERGKPFDRALRVKPAAKSLEPLRKAALEPREALAAAYHHHCLGTDQHVIASLYGVNPGRVAEACVALEWAVTNLRDAYLLAKAAKAKAAEEP